MADARFSRSCIGGKRSARIEARVTDEMKFDADKKAHELGMSTSDYLERLLAVALYGFDHVLNVERERTKQVCGLSALFQHGGE